MNVAFIAWLVNCCKAFKLHQFSNLYSKFFSSTAVLYLSIYTTCLIFGHASFVTILGVASVSVLLFLIFVPFFSITVLIFVLASLRAREIKLLSVVIN